MPKLLPKLLVSVDPDPSITNASISKLPPIWKLLNNTIRLWETTISQLDSNTLPLASEILKQKYLDLRKVQASLKLKSPLSFDLDIMHGVLSNLQSSAIVPPAIFVDHCKDSLYSYQKQINLMAKSLTSTNKFAADELAKLGQALTLAYNDVAKLYDAIKTLNNNHWNVLKAQYTQSVMNNLSASVKQIKEVIYITGILKFDQASTKLMAKVLFDQVKNMTNSQANANVTLQSAITQLSNDINNLKANSGDPTQINQKQQQLTNTVQEGINTQSSLVPEYKATADGFVFVATLAGDLDGAPQAGAYAQQLATVGVSAVTVGETIANFSAIAAVSGPLAPAVAIAGGVITIFSALSGLFSSSDSNQPDPTQQMLQSLSQQMQDEFNQVGDALEKVYQGINRRIDQDLNILNKNMANDFSQVRDMIQSLSTTMVNGFNMLQGLLNHFYSDVMDQFATLNNQNNKLTDLISHTQTTLDSINQKISKGFALLYAEPYATTVDQALNYHAYYRFPTVPLSSSQVFDYYSKLENWATKGVTNALETGANLNISDPLTWCEQVFSSDVESNINLIAGYAQTLDSSITVSGTLANPTLLANAARNLIAFLQATPEFDPLPAAIPNDISNIASLVLQIDSFITSVQTSETVFNFLFDNYRSALVNVIIRTYQSLAKQLTVEKSWKDKLTALELRVDNISKFEEIRTDMGSALPVNFFETSCGIAAVNTVKAKAAQIKTLLSILNPLKDLATADEVVGTLHVLAEARGILEDLITYIDTMVTTSYNASLAAYNTSLAAYKESLATHKSSPPGTLTPLAPSPPDKDILFGMSPKMEASIALTLAYELPASILSVVVNAEFNAFISQVINVESLALTLPATEILQPYFNNISRETLNNALCEGNSPDNGFKIDLVNALDNLTIAHRLLQIFVALAFKDLYVNDPAVRTYLQAGLWDNADFSNYVHFRDIMTNGTAHGLDFVLVELINKIVPNVDRLQQLINSEINKAVAVTKKNSVLVQSKDPLLSAVIDELNLFSQICFGLQLSKNNNISNFMLVRATHKKPLALPSKPKEPVRSSHTTVMARLLPLVKTPLTAHVRPTAQPNKIQTLPNNPPSYNSLLSPPPGRPPFKDIINILKTSFNNLLKAPVIAYLEQGIDNKTHLVFQYPIFESKVDEKAGIGILNELCAQFKLLKDKLKLDPSLTMTVVQDKLIIETPTPGYARRMTEWLNAAGFSSIFHEPIVQHYVVQQINVG